MSREALFSIHDVRPATLPGVRGLVDLVVDAGHPPPVLLVVPGDAWRPDDLRALERLAGAGCALAGHGWSHRAPPAATLHHRVHAAVLSRDQAEHLSRNRADVRDRVVRCHAWFACHGFEPPDFYVPPAWAPGPLRRADLEELPFRYWETLTGLVDAGTGRRRWLPLVGFEADTAFRRRALRAINALGLGAGALLRRPVRVALHPRDLELRLADDVRALVRRPWRRLAVREVFGDR